jgi:fermentation-respiration switch protein FrsA (DUF1100 family)
MRRRLWPLVLFAALAVLLAGCDWSTLGSSELAARAHSTVPILTGLPAARRTPYGVGVRTETFVDSSRPTPPHNGLAGAATRSLTTIVLYPTREASAGAVAPAARPVRRRFPLVVVIHGASTGPGSNVGVLKQVAAAGYVVAMPKFPLTGAMTPGGVDPSDYVNEPADVSFVIDQLLRLTHDPRSVYHQLIRRDDVGVIGLSLGGSPALALGYNAHSLDNRVEAVIAASSAKTVPGLPAFAGTYTYPPTPLLLIRGGPADFAAGFSDQIFAEAHAPKLLLTITNGQHVPLLVDDAGGHASVRAVIAFLNRYLKSRHDALEVLFDQARDPRVATLVPRRQDGRER